MSAAQTPLFIALEAFATYKAVVPKMIALPEPSEPSPVDRAMAAFRAAGPYHKPLAAMKLAKAMRGSDESEVPGWVLRMREDKDA